MLLESTQCRTPAPPGPTPMIKDPAAIRLMFARIAPWYDAVNHVGSAGLDLLWRRRLLVETLGRRQGAPFSRALDLCCGTGDVTFLLARQAGADLLAGNQPAEAHAGALDDEWPAAIRVCQAIAVPELRPSLAGAPRPEVIGLDFTAELLAIARRRAGAFARSHAVQPRFVLGDAMNAPFPDAAFDVVTIAFGLRNLADWQAGLREMARLLRPGGVLGILEFGRIVHPGLRRLFAVYFCGVLPAAGRLLTGTNAYAYLRDSCLAFPARRRVMAAIRNAGLRRIRARLLSAGIATVFTAVKQ
ncbi:MAG: bifunctional demethylmenaquinone methyltransferase/2-methoxy-6-polyprenyl-1,4-benzoquinol methylase UbiE [Candidatus Sumerlaeia bacterium]